MMNLNEQLAAKLVELCSDEEVLNKQIIVSGLNNEYTVELALNCDFSEDDFINEREPKNWWYNVIVKKNGEDDFQHITMELNGGDSLEAAEGVIEDIEVLEYLSLGNPDEEEIENYDQIHDEFEENMENLKFEIKELVSL